MLPSEHVKLSNGGTIFYKPLTPEADLGARLPPKTPIHLYHGSEDDIAPFAHVDLYEGAIPGAIVHRPNGRYHQLNGDLAEVAAGVRALT
ncbi:hypothetical protein [Bosea vaviloviae]|uniref:Uncharacterized protein n=1 Tax=Bosea vaviloviae TaxID=1526658 RepID=A0A1D7U9I1_9HYPH|nr:hypothetical protein [Bosea vaviloviae]AOO84031.1 hypothetical protein BHK69_29510 [Bosea vaviloviae]